MEIKLPFGRSDVTACLPDEYTVDIIEPSDVPADPDPLGCVVQALEAPLGGCKLEDFAGARSVSIAISDKTRPVPHHYLLPPLLERLEKIGIAQQAITLYIAPGTHTPMEPSEYSMVLPESVYSKFKIISHDSTDESNLVLLGETGRGTPVWVNRGYVAADLRIVLGNIEPHQFAGFSGGVKTAAIGLAGQLTITRNHALMMHPDSRLGDYETNPARQDVEEIGEKIGVHFALNAVLNHHKKIVHVLAGTPRAVMAAGIPLSRRVCQVKVPELYDFIITSAGGHPKDINLYQAQKALGHATLVMRPGGTVILVAACPEGAGSQCYETWVKQRHTNQQVIYDFNREGFRIGPHKAYQIARDAAKVYVLFCTEMAQDLVSDLLMNPVDSLQAGIDEVLPGLSTSSRIGVMPNAASTIPFVG